MSWQSMWLDRQVSTDDLHQGLAEVLAVDAGEVAVGERLDQLEGKVMATLRVESGGEFPCGIDAVSADEGPTIDHATVRALCARWGCRALVPDDDDDQPYRYLLVSADTDLEPVAVDREALDDREALIVIGTPGEPVPDPPTSRQRATSAPPDSSS